MVFVTAIGFFIVPALLGGRRETMITQLIIDQVQQTMNWGFAGAISVLLLVVVYSGVLFVPTYIAFYRRHEHRLAIGIVNFLLGWTGIGWAATMVWALTEEIFHQKLSVPGPVAWVSNFVVVPATAGPIWTALPPKWE